MRLEDLFEANPALKVSGSVVGGKSPVVLGTEFFDMAKKQGATPKQASNVIELFQKNNPQFRGPKMTQFMQQFFTNNPDVFKTANDNVKLATGSGGTGKGKIKIKPSGWSKLLGFLGKGLGVAGVIAPFVTPSPNVGDGTISDEDRQAMEIADQIMRSLVASDPQAYIDMIDAEYANADKDDVQFVDPRTHPYYTDAQKRVADTQKMLDLEPIGGGIPQPSAQTDTSTLAQPEIEPEELPTSQPDKTPKFPGIPVLPDLPDPESPLEIPEPAPSVAPTAPKQPEPTRDPEDKPDAPTRDKPIEIPTTIPTKPEVDPGKEPEPTVDPDAPSPKGPVVNPDAPGQPKAPVTDPEKLPDAPKVLDKPVTTRAPSTLTVPGQAPRVKTDIGTTQPPRGGKDKEKTRKRIRFGLPDLTKKQRDYTLSPFTPLPMPDPMKLARYKSFGESVEEREMTKAEKARETRLKKKYDDSGMKAAMKKQYGKDWETVYYATIRKQAMEEGYQILPPIDRDRYDEIQGMEGPMITRSGKVVYYDPQEGAYYDRDTDMYLTYDEWKELDKAPHTAEAVKPKDDPYSEPGRPGGKNQDKGKKSPSLPTAIRSYLKGGERSLGMPDPMNIHARLNASVEQRANALFDRALAEFKFNPRAGHRDQPSHPENRGLGDIEREYPDPVTGVFPDELEYEPELPDRSTSPRPRLRPEPEIDLSPDAEAPDQVHIKKSGAPASSPRPRLRPGSDRSTSPRPRLRPVSERAGPATAELIRSAAEKYKVPYHIAMGMADQESGFNNSARGDGGSAIGLFQIRQPAIDDVNRIYGTNFKLADVEDPAVNTDVAMRYYSAMKNTYGAKDDQVAVMMYNGGPGILKRGQKAQNMATKHANRVMKKSSNYQTTTPPATPRPDKPSIDKAVKQALKFNKPVSKSKVTYQDLARASGIKDPNKIYPGNIIKLPTGRTYTVKKGDTLSGIASRFNKGKLGEGINEWGGDDQYQAVEGFIENALSIFDEMLDNGVDELRARAEAHDYLKGDRKSVV